MEPAPATDAIALSAAVARMFPALAQALASAGVALAGGATAVVAAGSAERPNAIEVAPGGETALDRAATPATPARLTIAAGDEAFAAALIAALLRGADTPAAAAPASRAQLALAARVAVRDVTVLIAGPTGTGKEVLARYIHRCSPRRDCPLVAVNCAALPEAMLEALLFGHERGAFTGAAAAARGLFRAADTGTLFLDEVAELPLALQGKLLRALQEREVLPIGATVPQRIDVRLIAASNRDLIGDVAAGRFRADLYYRLAVFPLSTAALAERPGDLDALVAALLLRGGGPGPVLLPTPAARARLASHGWPGNVRELDNVLQRARILSRGDRIEAQDIVFDAGAEPLRLPPPRSLGRQVRAHETAAIAAALSATDGRRGAAALRLGISERTLRYKLAAMRLPATAATLQ